MGPRTVPGGLQEGFGGHLVAHYFRFLFGTSFGRGFGTVWEDLGSVWASLPGAKVVLLLGTSSKNRLFTGSASRTPPKVVLEGFLSDFGSILGAQLEPCRPPGGQQMFNFLGYFTNDSFLVDLSI